jgi:hypothetical protein
MRPDKLRIDEHEPVQEDRQENPVSPKDEEGRSEHPTKAPGPAKGTTGLGNTGTEDMRD